MRHLITLDDISPPEINRVFELSAELKLKFGQGIRESLLPGRILALLFEKQSLRTRVSFEAGIAHLGGNSLLLGGGRWVWQSGKYRGFCPGAGQHGGCDCGSIQDSRHG